MFLFLSTSTPPLSLSVSDLSPFLSSSPSFIFPIRNTQKTTTTNNKGVFEVLVSTPPPRSLGYHSLPPDTHNGDRIEIGDRAFVVRRLVLRYRLERGRYVKAAQALEVASQGRYFVDQFLDQLVEK